MLYNVYYIAKYIEQVTLANKFKRKELIPELLEGPWEVKLHAIRLVSSIIQNICPVVYPAI